MKDLVIVGAGDFGREIAWVVHRINAVKNEWKIIGFVDDGHAVGEKIDDIEVIGNTNWLSKYSEEIYAICSIGDSQVRRQVVSNYIFNKNVKLPVLIDPSVIAAESVIIGGGSVVCAGAVLSVHCHFGEHAIVNLNCTFGHDAVLNDFCTVHPGSNISGKVVLEEEVFVGTGSKITQGLRVTKGTTIGAGSVVVRDITESGTYVGIPCKKVVK